MDAIGLIGKFKVELSPYELDASNVNDKLIINYCVQSVMFGDNELSFPYNGYKFTDKEKVRYYNRNDKLHREDGPAIEYKNKTEYYWYHNGLRHRENGPAVEYTNGDKFWYRNGNLHRIDGPAIEWANGNEEWYIEGKKIEKLD